VAVASIAGRLEFLCGPERTMHDFTTRLVCPLGVLSTSRSVSRVPFGTVSIETVVRLCMTFGLVLHVRLI